MTYRPVLSTGLFLTALGLALACSGSTFTTAGDGDGDTGGDGDLGGDGDAPGGDGDGPVGDGDDPTGDGDGPIIDPGIEGKCSSDTDCLAVGVTSASCYSPSCGLPTAASEADVMNDPCLVEWLGEMGPTPTDACRYESSEPIACPLGCAQPPTCIHAYCDAGTCALNTTQDGSDCTSAGTGGSSGTGGGSNDGCGSLDEARTEALEEARKCLTNGIVQECTGGQTINNECGCPVLVNDNQADKVQTARDAYAAWNAACEPPDHCALVDCAAPGEAGTCQGTYGEPGICGW